MDPRITALQSTTFQGRRLTRRQIAAVQETVLSFPGLSRRELAHTICEQLRWHTAKGDNRIQAVLRMLEELERLGVLSLPTKDLSQARGARKPVVWGSRTDAPAAIEGDLDALLPIRLQVVSDAEGIEEWNEYVARYHYMGFRHPIGPHLRYFLLDGHGRKLGCLLFSHGSRQLQCRDEWIGWPEGYRKHLDRVVGNNRFLLFPWVRVGNLASKALSIATGRLADDWEERHGFRPVLVETFADTSRSDGTCYRAANWVDLGETRGGKGKAPKRVYVYPLATDFREVLLHGPQRSASRRSPRRPRLAPDDPFVLLWRDLIGALTAVAAEHDRVWQVRRRVLHTLLVMLFVYRLVLSSGEQGYATTLAELWEQCRALGVALPQPDPVAASAMCRARAKVDENVFRSVHAEILKRASCPPAWRGHRLFAIDGSKLNLPRPLIRCGYRTPSDTSHYPQGLLSCLVQLPERIPVAFDLCAHGNERRAALDLLPALSPGDVVIYDRGYFSWELLAVHLERDMHPVFRIQKSASPIMDAFLAGSRTDAVVEAMPGEKVLRKLRKRQPQALAEPVRLRLVKYTAGGSTIGLATTLLDSETHPASELADLYGSRWGIEEMYKISKSIMEIAPFHARTERGVRQELFAHFNLMAMTRIFTNHGDAILNARKPSPSATDRTANFKNSLAAVARNLEALLLKHAATVAEAIQQVLDCVATGRQKPRPGRSYERRSRKPLNRWHGKPREASKA